MASDELVGRIVSWSRAARLLLGGAGLGLVGYLLVRLAGTDPDSLLAYVGGAFLVVGQFAALVGLVGVAWLFLRG